MKLKNKDERAIEMVKKNQFGSLWKFFYSLKIYSQA